MKRITQDLINNAKTIQICSGDIASEGGVCETYTGKKTVHAIKSRLTKERCGGDRWANLVIDEGEIVIR